jgi:hypothetical protein
MVRWNIGTEHVETQPAQLHAGPAFENAERVTDRASTQMYLVAIQES